MMIYDGPTTYTKEGFTKGFEKNKLYFVAYLDSNNKLNTKQVYVESIYSESIPGPGYISGSRNNLWWHARAPTGGCRRHPRSYNTAAGAGAMSG